MSLDPQQLSDVQAIVAEAANVRAAAAVVRERFPGMRALVLDSHDMRAEEPTLQIGSRALYMVATDGHCWTVTGDPAQASGVILTQS